MQFSEWQSRRLMDIAKEAIRASLARRVSADALESDPFLMQRAGCFVSLHDVGTHRLRGCIGRIEADRPLALVVQQTAVSVLSDPRFGQMRVGVGDLNNLEIEISVLSPLMPTTHALDFDPLSDGIYLTINDQVGCFLPQVGQQTGWSREQLLDRLCTEKLRLTAKAWQQPAARLQRFSVTLLGPEPFVS